MDQYTTVTQQGYFQRIKNSFLGVVIGLVFFAGSFILLWKNEGNYAREKVALKEIAAATVEGSVDEVTDATAGKPVHLVGELLSEEQIGDPGYILPGDYLMLRRQAEMFQWVEEEKSETREKMGGGSETVTTYKYDKKWRTGRVDSSQFRMVAGHENPEPTLNNAEYSVSEASFGAWSGMDVIEHLWPSVTLEINEDMMDPEMTTGKQQGNYIYVRRNPSSSGDTIGDERLTWNVLYPGTFSVIARHDSDGRLASVVASNGKDKFLVESGTRSIAEMIETEKGAQSMLAWILRGAGFIIMWIGLSLILGPIATLLSIIPVAASIGRFAIGGITFVVALGLTATTVIISWVAHSPIVLAVAIAGGLVVAFVWLKKKSATPAAKLTFS